MVVWNLERIYSFKETDTLFTELEKKVQTFAALRSILSPSLSPTRFMQIVRLQEEIRILSSQLSGYASLWFCENSSDTVRTAHRSRVEQRLADLSNQTLFFSLWFKGLSDAEAAPFIKAAGPYNYLFERMRQFKPYTLSESEEKILQLKEVTSSSLIESMYDIITARYRYNFFGKELTIEEVNRFKQSMRRKERVLSYKVVFEKYAQEEPVLGELYRAVVLDCANESLKLRGFSSPLAVRNISNDIPDAVITTLLSVVRSQVKLFQDYFKLKAKICKLSSFDRFDLYVPSREPTQKYSFAVCKKITLETYHAFSPTMAIAAEEIFTAGHVHSDLLPHKRSGAFCSSITKDLPPFILLNHGNKLQDLFTMMHEFGHGIHHMLARKQTEFTFHSCLPLAETASTFGELLLSRRLLVQATTKKEKIAILLHLLDGHYASIVRQAYFVIFEIAAHEKLAAGATFDELNKLYISLLKEQFGSTVKVDPIFAHEWKYIPHIYHSPFYCYAYTFGELLVLSLFALYEKDGASFVPKYLRILSSGGSRSPAAILADVGIDISQKSFWEGGFNVIAEELAELKRLVK